jgi:hypothetical protein
VSEQLSLFESDRRILVPRAEKLVMDKGALQQWKQSIFDYQQTIRQQNIPQQQTLFDLAPTTWHRSGEIDPFSLKLHSAEFYRSPEPPDFVDGSDRGCLYFVIDNTLPLLLYVGETKLTAHKRWKGVHYCRNYILNYIELHRRYELDVSVVSAFWTHVPPDKKILHQWERELIIKWRSPFNRQNWELFGQPFGKR